MTRNTEALTLLPSKSPLPCPPPTAWSVLFPDANQGLFQRGVLSVCVHEGGGEGMGDKIRGEEVGSKNGAAQLSPPKAERKMNQLKTNDSSFLLC